MHICARMLRKSVKSVSVFIYAYWIFWNNFYNEFKKASALFPFSHRANLKFSLLMPPNNNKDQRIPFSSVLHLTGRQNNFVVVRNLFTLKTHYENQTER